MAKAIVTNSQSNIGDCSFKLEPIGNIGYANISYEIDGDITNQNATISLNHLYGSASSTVHLIQFDSNDTELNRISTILTANDSFNSVTLTNQLDGDCAKVTIRIAIDIALFVDNIGLLIQ